MLVRRSDCPDDVYRASPVPLTDPGHFRVHRVPELRVRGQPIPGLNGSGWRFETRIGPEDPVTWDVSTRRSEKPWGIFPKGPKVGFFRVLESQKPRAEAARCTNSLVWEGKISGFKETKVWCPLFGQKGGPPLLGSFGAPLGGGFLGPVLSERGALWGFPLSGVFNLN